MTIRDAAITNEVIGRVFSAKDEAAEAERIIEALDIMLATGMRWYAADMSACMSEAGMVSLRDYLMAA